MSEEQTEIQDETAEPVADPTPEVLDAPEAPEALVDLRYEYQPTDEQNRPIGAKQVILYKTPEELATKLTEQNTLLIRKLRSETRKNRLGIVDEETISDEVPRYQEPVSFSPRVLSAEERFQLSRDLIDPDKFEEASSTLFEATIGAKPEVLSKTLTDLQHDRLVTRAKAEVDAFRADNPDYIMCQENSDAITNWMSRYTLAPVKANFQKAYDTLRAAGVIIESAAQVAPQAAEPTVTVAEALPAPVQEEPPAPEPVAPAHSRVPTALNRSNSADTGTVRPAGDDIVYEVINNGQKLRFTGLAAIRAMPSAEFKRRVNQERGFSQKYEKLEAEAAERRRARRQ